MFLGAEHGGFIFWAYMFAGLALLLLTIIVWRNMRQQKNKLDILEASGARRRKRQKSTRADKNG